MHHVPSGSRLVYLPNHPILRGCLLSPKINLISQCSTAASRSRPPASTQPLRKIEPAGSSTFQRPSRIVAAFTCSELWWFGASPPPLPLGVRPHTARYFSSRSLQQERESIPTTPRRRRESQSTPERHPTTTHRCSRIRCRR